MTILRSLVIAGAATLPLASLALAAPASASVAKSSPAITLFSGDAKFTAAGHNWVLSINGFRQTASISLLTTNEDDGFTFLSVPASALKVNAKTGHATFNTANALKPIASINLTFSPTKAKKQACKSGSETVFSGRISGSVTLVASKKVTFKSSHVAFSSPFLDVDNGCVAKTGGGNGCFGGFWSVGSAVTAIGETPGLTAGAMTVSVTKTVVPKAPKNATESSDVIGVESKPSFNSKKRTLSVKATSGPVTGSALLTSSGAPAKRTFTCTSKGKKFKATDSEFFGKYASQKGHQFVGQSVLLGKETVAAKGDTIFDVLSFKKA
ncbi:MAG TPA: hypothetical protein VN767_28240 [Streptosporangiaceae bacterium]|nr:hypothetical protein [Streptosporangiaceae bacterium]